MLPFKKSCLQTCEKQDKMGFSDSFRNCGGLCSFCSFDLSMMGPTSRRNSIIITFSIDINQL